MEGFVFKTKIKLSQMGNELDRADRRTRACGADRDGGSGAGGQPW